MAWLTERGAELVIEVARYFASRCSFQPHDERAHIWGLMGPDEYHTGYPDAPGRGLRDNTYPNVMPAWVFERAADCLVELEGHPAQALRDRLTITGDERSPRGEPSALR